MQCVAGLLLREVGRVIGDVATIGTSMGSGRKAGWQGGVDVCTCLELNVGCLDLDGRSNVRGIAGCAGRLAGREDGRGVGSVWGSGGGQGRDGVGNRGRRRDIAAGGRLESGGRLLLLLLLEDGIVAETVSLGLFAIVAGGVRLVALKWVTR